MHDHIPVLVVFKVEVGRAPRLVEVTVHGVQVGGLAGPPSLIRGGEVLDLVVLVVLDVGRVDGPTLDLVEEALDVPVGVQLDALEEVALGVLDDGSVEGGTRDGQTVNSLK